MTTLNINVTTNVVAGGGVPPVGSDVTVTTHVVADADWDVDEIVVENGGTLEWLPSAGVAISCRKLNALPGSTLLSHPANGSIVHTLEIKSVPDNGAFIFGTMDFAGEVKTPYMRLDTEPQAAATSVTLPSAPLNWRVGDKVVFPDSRQHELYHPWWQTTPDAEHPIPWDGPGHVERRTISAISTDGRTITFDAPLTYAHPAGRFEDNGPAEVYPHVVNLTRNVVIKSSVANSDDRGFVEVKDRADLTLRYVEFKSLGQSKLASAGATYGNHRTGLTLHHLYGPVGGQPGGWAAEIDGCTFWCGMTGHPWKGPSIHDTHYSLWKDCVFYNHAGWSFAAWHGNESYNRLEGCFALFGRGTGDNIGSPGLYGDEPAGFWFAGPNNSVVDCVAANCVSTPGYGFAAYGYKIFNLGGTHPVPTALGCPSFVNKDLQALPLQEWSGNESYGQENGITLWFINASNSATSDPDAYSTVSNTKLWNLSRYGCFLYPTANITWDTWWDLRRRWLMDKQNSVSLTSGDYYAGKQVVKNALIRGTMMGIQDATYGGGGGQPVAEHLYENIEFFCWWDYLSGPPRAPGSGGGGSNRLPRIVTLRNTRHQDKTGWTSDYLGPTAAVIVLEPNYDEAPNLVVSNRLLIEDFQRVVGQNFEAYHDEAAADAILLQTGSWPGLFGAPVAGLTNAENLAQHGVCWGGEHSTGAVAVPWVKGGRVK